MRKSFLWRMPQRILRTGPVAVGKSFMSCNKEAPLISITKRLGELNKNILCSAFLSKSNTKRELSGACHSLTPCTLASDT